MKLVYAVLFLLVAMAVGELLIYLSLFGLASIAVAVIGRYHLPKRSTHLVETRR